MSCQRLVAEERHELKKHSRPDEHECPFKNEETVSHLGGNHQPPELLSYPKEDIPDTNHPNTMKDRHSLMLMSSESKFRPN